MVSWWAVRTVIVKVSGRLMSSTGYRVDDLLPARYFNFVQNLKLFR